MIKISEIDQATKTLLSGLASSGALGAGVGALGMGAAEYFSPRDPDNPESRQRSILKSMLLGGAMGGVAGAGGRAVANHFNPELAADSSSGIGKAMELFNRPDKSLATTETSIPEHVKNVAAYSPALTGGAVGLGTSAMTGYGRVGDRELFDKMDKTKLDNLTKSESRLNEYLHTPKASRLSKFPTMHPFFRGGVAGGAAYGISKLLQGGEHLKQNYEANNDPARLRQLISQ